MRNSFILLFMLLSTAVFSQQQLIDQSNKLIEAKKYKSAYQLLDKVDPQNNTPSVSMTKANLILDYFVSSVMHQAFALEDLQPEQDLNELRSKEGDYEFFAFPADTILAELIKEYPEKYELHLTLGRYYHDVHLKYGSNWIIPDSMIVLKFMTSYGRAYEKGVYDARSLYGLGYGFLLFKNYKQSIPFFKQSIEADSTDPAAYYNLGYACLFNDERGNAVNYAVKAIELYQYPAYKAEAARLAAVAFAEMNDAEKALDLYRFANQVNPNDYNTLRPLLAMEIQLNDTAFRRTAGNFLALAPRNPAIYQDLMQIFWKNRKQDVLIDFLDHARPYYTADTTVSANLIFFIGKIHFDKGDTTLAIRNFRQSRELFNHVYEPEHAVFTVIDQYLELQE